MRQTGDEVEYARRIHALLEYNPYAEGSRGNPYITYVDPDQDHSAPFMYETPAYNTLLSLARGIALVGGGFELDHGHRQSSQITDRLELVSRRWVQMHTNIYADRTLVGAPI